MGGYMSTPNTEKISVDENCKNLIYGASSMQGWRISQEVTRRQIVDSNRIYIFYISFCNWKVLVSVDLHILHDRKTTICGDQVVR